MSGRELMTIAHAASKEAADDMPSVNGLTSELRISACITVPATARLAPDCKEYPWHTEIHNYLPGP